MDSYANAVKDYFQTQSPLYRFDDDVLNTVIESMDVAELCMLNPLTVSLDAAEDIHVLFVATKIFNRHNDVLSGATHIVGDDIIISDDSSISELHIEPITLIECNRNCIYKVKDIDAKYLPVLPMEAYFELLNEIILFKVGHYK